VCLFCSGHRYIALRREAASLCSHRLPSRWVVPSKRNMSPVQGAERTRTKSGMLSETSAGPNSPLPLRPFPRSNTLPTAHKYEVASP
jgi:hypothetical protein